MLPIFIAGTCVIETENILQEVAVETCPLKSKVQYKHYF